MVTRSRMRETAAQLLHKAVAVAEPHLSYTTLSLTPVYKASHAYHTTHNSIQQRHAVRL